MTEQGPEPTGWELMRGIKDLRDELRGVGARVVSTDVYLADKTASNERMARVEARQRDAEAALAEERKERLADQENAKRNETESARTRGTMRLTIALAIAAPIISIIFARIFPTGGA